MSQSSITPSDGDAPQHQHHHHQHPRPPSLDFALITESNHTLQETDKDMASIEIIAAKLDLNDNDNVANDEGPNDEGPNDENAKEPDDSGNHFNNYNYGNQNIRNNNNRQYSNANTNSNYRYQKQGYQSRSYSASYTAVYQPPHQQTQQPTYMPQYPRYIPMNQYSSNGNPSIRRKSQPHPYNYQYPEGVDYNNGFQQQFYMNQQFVPVYYNLSGSSESAASSAPSSNTTSPQFIPQQIYPDANLYYNPQNRLMYPHMQWYEPQRVYSNGNRTRNRSRPNTSDEEAVADEEEEEEEDTSVKITTLNILNLPSAYSDVDSISGILGELVKSEGDDRGFQNVRIYKYSDQELCWCSFQLSDLTKLDLLITKLNGYNFHDSILKCFIQPPSSLNNNYNYNSPNEYTRRYSYGYRYHQNYNNNNNNNNNSNSNRYHYNSYDRRSSQNTPRNKPLGNNYNSIVFPDLDNSGPTIKEERRIDIEDSKDVDDGIEEYQDEDIIDDNELTTDELKEFNESRHVSKDRLFIGNIPFNSSYHSLWLYLTNGGENIIIKELQLKFDSNGISKGFAVCITNGLNSSIELIENFNGTYFENRKLIVRFDKQNGLIFKSHMKRRYDGVGSYS